MRNILVLQHVAHEPLGTLNPLLKKHRLRIRYVNFERDPNHKINIDKYNGIIVLGGPMGVYQQDQYPHLKYEIELIEKALKKDIPILGICLGAQLIASALKADVRRHENVEAGWTDLVLTESGKKESFFKDFKNKEKIFQMHGDTFDIPKSAVHLAKNENCESQAFKYGDKVYAIQFHLEVDAPMIKRWTNIPATLKLINKLGPNNKQQVLDETKIYIQRSLELSKSSFKSFIDHFDIPAPSIVLGSDHAKPK